MPYSVVKFQDTPNPNAVKCVLDKPLPHAGQPGVPRSFFSADQASGDPLASRLFALPGVTNVLLADAWLTVGKSPEAAWGPIHKGVKRVLGELA